MSDKTVETETGPLVLKLAKSIPTDVANAVASIGHGLSIVRELELQVKHINGFSSFLKTKGDGIAQLVADLEREAKEVEKKLLGAPKREIVSRVDHAKAEEVARARLMDDEAEEPDAA